MVCAFVNRCGRYPPEVRTAIPVDGRFEHIVLSCNATSDHAIIWIEREAEKALQVSQLVSVSIYVFMFMFTVITHHKTYVSNLTLSIKVANTWFGWFW